MFDFLKKMTGMDSETVDLAQLARDGAQIVDVRTPEEYRGGHVKGSVNIPLSDLNHALSRIRKDRPVITCCASGMRSASAKSILERAGFEQVHNGGGWAGLQRRLAA
jgi:phage shock protein E